MSHDVREVLEEVIARCRAGDLHLGSVGTVLYNDAYLKERYGGKLDSALPILTKMVLGELDIPPVPKKDFALRYNHGKPQWSLVHFGSLEPMVRVLEFGAQKYSTDNWKSGFPDKKIMESMMRHLACMMDGEINDPETGLPHVGHLMCNCMFLSYQQLNRKDNGATNKGGDDARGDGRDEGPHAAHDK